MNPINPAALEHYNDLEARARTAFAKFEELRGFL